MQVDITCFLSRCCVRNASLPYNVKRIVLNAKRFRVLAEGLDVAMSRTSAIYGIAIFSVGEIFDRLDG